MTEPILTEGEKMETGWLIEIPMKLVGGSALWWTGKWNTGYLTDPWTVDASLAVRFSREQDAQAVISGTLRLKEAIATEHIWG